ncbi:MAG: exodeoxyribonuclease V subunit gamma, partial [Actinomycetota bacterium]|nr:exodeoxyribonuclease V subunit gamma [Actinomycetota bacterium]
MPARGVERWLAQRLSYHLGAGSGGDGVCARVDFPHPDELLDAAVAAASPEHAVAVDVWHPDRLVWPLLEVLDACPPDEQWCEALRHYLAQGGEELSTRRLTVARRLTGLHATAAQARPDLLQRWAQNVDDDVPPDLRWQP